MKVSQRQADALCATLLRAFQWEDRTKGFFAYPVCRTVAPNYYEVIQEPMDLDTVSTNLSSGVYHGRDPSSMIHDLFLILDNAVYYNPPSHAVHREAHRIRHIISCCLHDTVSRLLERTGGTSLLKETRDQSAIDAALILSEGFL